MTKEGRIYLTNEHLINPIDNPEEGQICRVMCSSVELFSEAIQDDSLKARKMRSDKLKMTIV